MPPEVRETFLGAGTYTRGPSRSDLVTAVVPHGVPPRGLPRLRWPVVRLVFAGILIAQTLAAAANLLLASLSPCSLRRFGAAAALLAGDCATEYNVSSRIATLAIGSAYVSGAALVMRKLWRVARQQYAHTKAKTSCPRRGTPRGVSPGSWVSAASPDLFRETVSSLRTGNTVVGLFLIPFSCVIVTAELMVQVPEYRAIPSNATVMGICGDSQVCHISSSFSNLAVMINSNFNVLICLLFLITPDCSWGRTALMAAHKTGEVRVKRLAWTPYLSFISLLLQVYQVVHRQLRLINNTYGSVEVCILFLIQLLALVYHAWMIWYIMLPQDVARFLSARLRSFRCSREPRESQLEQQLSSMTDRRGSSADVMLDALIAAQTVLWGRRRFWTGTPVWIAVVVSACRVVAFLAMLAMYERTATFEDLEHSPGFGLVVRATALRKALEAALSGHTFSRTLPRYRATLTTMQQTLAVSYRWQPEEAQIAVCASINMSAFQMHELLTVINRSSCRYVWLDRLSVPQHECKLKYTLLARMMTVYASAGSTLVIRGLEDEGSRYHQRAWTCQEFCVASKLRIITQSEGGRELRRSSTMREQEWMEELRVRFHAGEVVPFWLRGCRPGLRMTGEQGRQAIEEFEELCSYLHCQHPGDMVRALIPMLTHRPVEGQQELISLVLEMEAATGENLQEWKALLFEQHVTLKHTLEQKSSFNAAQVWRAVRGKFRKSHGSRSGGMSYTVARSAASSVYIGPSSRGKAAVAKSPELMRSSTGGRVGNRGRSDGDEESSVHIDEPLILTPSLHAGGSWQRLRKGKDAVRVALEIVTDEPSCSREDRLELIAQAEAGRVALSQAWASGGSFQKNLPGEPSRLGR